MQSLSPFVEGKLVRQRVQHKVLSVSLLEPWFEAAQLIVSAHFVVQDAEEAVSRDCTGFMHAMKAISECGPVLCAGSSNPCEENPAM